MLNRMDRCGHRTAALMTHHEQQRRTEVVGTELDAAQHDALVEHLGARADHGQIANPPVEDNLRRHARVECAEKIVANGC